MVVLKKIFSQLAFIFILFVILELISIKLFPEYSQNQKYKKLTNSNKKNLSIIQKGKYQHFELIEGLKIRSDKNDIKKKLADKNKKIWIFGDSITGGYGLKYSDTFFYLLEKILNTNEQKFKVFPISRNAGTFEDLVSIVQNSKDIFGENDYIISQFTYMDIAPPQNINKNQNPIQSKSGIFKKISSTINEFRFEYLHESTFIRVLTHYASIMKRKTSGTCSERGMHALGRYSYSYGSQKYLEESKLAWTHFEERLQSLKKFSKEKKLKLIILISPISLQLENHNKINFHNLDLNCSEIDARKKLLNLLNEYKITYSDPLVLFNEAMQTDLAENNFEPFSFFSEYDTAHPSSKGSLLMAISLYKTIINY